jgi:hypothetical protein
MAVVEFYLMPRAGRHHELWRSVLAHPIKKNEIFDLL